MKHWTTTTLGQFTTLQRGHDLPTQDRKNGPIPILGSFGITGWHNESKVRGPGLTVGRSGASFGVVTYSGVDFWPLNTALFVKDFNGNDERFAYYFLKSINFKSFNSGSAVQSLNRNHIHPINISVPPLPEQKAIAQILGTLDDKIELNRQTNKILEAMARAIFKSWFVDFDPVHAKRAARDGTQSDTHSAALSPDILDLFPDSFQDSELGEIPTGWEVGEMSHFTNVQGGFAFKSKDFIDTNGCKVIKIKNIGDNKDVDIGNCDQLPIDYALKSSDFVLSNGDVLMAMTGAKVGKFGMIVCDSSPTLLNQRVARFLPKRVDKPWIVYCALMIEEILEQIVGMAEGSAQPNVSAQGIMSAKLVNTSAPIEKKFVQIVDPFFDEIVVNTKRSRVLIDIRNTLLPKLISGELRIKDAEKFLKDAPL